jgi:hypothetical protein
VVNLLKRVCLQDFSLHKVL